MITYTRSAELKKGVTITLLATVYRDSTTLDGTVTEGKVVLLKEACIDVDAIRIHRGNDYGYVLSSSDRKSGQYLPECVAVIGNVQLTDKSWKIVEDLKYELLRYLKDDVDYQEYAKSTDEEHDQDWISVIYDYAHDRFIASQVKTIPGTQVKSLHQWTYNGRRLTKNNKIQRG